jgi:hypothetical protein
MTMQKAMEVADQYDALIEQKLVERLSPELQQRKKDSNVVLKEIDQLIKSLDDRRTQGAFADSKTTLETLRIAWSFYDQKLAILNDDSLPPSIRSADAENVGRIEQIIPNLLRSADNPMTIVIVFFALFFDWALVQFFLRYLHETRPSETEITF